MRDDAADPLAELRREARELEARCPDPGPDSRAAHHGGRRRPDGAVPVPVGRHEAWVDAADEELVRAHRWRPLEQGHTVYAVARLPQEGGKQRSLYMHRLVLGLKAGDGVQARHVDGDGLNNTRANLRRRGRGLPRLLEDIDWEGWEPLERATILFVVRGGEVLLIRKKRGLGAGKINGPGGHIEPGETAEQAAVREVQEELLVTPTGVEEAGTLRFQFADGFSMSVRVFRASGCEGEPRETEEALPLWTPTGEIPYGEMWGDDAHWLPHMLAGERFDGRFLLDGDALLDWEVSGAL